MEGFPYNALALCARGDGTVVGWTASISPIMDPANPRRMLYLVVINTNFHLFEPGF